MKWRNARGSRNIEDRRTQRVSRKGGMGIVGIIAVLAIGLIFGVDVRPSLEDPTVVVAHALKPLIRL